MPLPKPKADESEEEFIERCIPLVIESEELDADDDDDREQATTICYSQWRDEEEDEQSDGEEEGEGKAADVAELMAVKILSEDDEGAVVGGIECLFASASTKDLQGEYFTPETQTWHETYKSAPTLFHHGLDDDIDLAQIGKRVRAEVRDDGLWVESWLDKSNEYWKLVRPLLEAKALYYSPGSAPHLVRKEEDGRLLSYPVVEDTLTVTPAQHRLRPIERIKAAYKSAGLDLPETLQDSTKSGDAAGGAACSEEERARERALTEIEEALIEIEMEV